MKNPPKTSKADVALTISKALVAVIPLAGGSLATLSELLEWPISRRRQLWMEELAQAVSELQQRIEELARPLAENEAFVTAALQATQIALRTHQQEKLDALRNAVKNSALKQAPDDNRQLMFLRFVDEFTPLHLRVLAIFDNPAECVAETGRRFQVSMGSLGTVIVHCVPELVREDELSSQIFRDLQNRGLLMQGMALNGAMSQQGLLTRRTSSLGREFLKFIS